MSFYSSRNYGQLPPPLDGKMRLFTVEMNPYGHRVQLVLAAKGIPHDTVNLDPRNLPAWFVERNPRLKIPVLELPTSHGDQYLYESVVICDYLDEKYSNRNPLHSKNPYQKAMDRLLIERFNELIKGSLECFDTNFVFGREQILGTLQTFEQELAERGTTFFGGSRPGMLDLMIWPWIERLYMLRCLNERVFDAKKSMFPYLSEWGDQMQVTDAVKKHAYSPLEHFNFYRSEHANMTNKFED